MLVIEGQGKMEEWKQIEGFDYEVSNRGNVRRIGKKQITACKSTEKVGNENIIRKMTVRLWKDNTEYKRAVHRLVAIAFIPNPDNKPIIDHIDNNPMNNNYTNLRWATLSENNCNIKCRKTNKLGYKGVYYDKRRDKYYSEIRFNNMRYGLGYHNTPEEAFEAYKKKAEELHGDFAKW